MSITFKKIESENQVARDLDSDWNKVKIFKSRDKFVDKDGHEVGLDYKGICYRIIAKYERKYGLCERINCKKAFEIKDGSALLIPNMIDGIPATIVTWPKVVDEEVEMARLINSMGLLSLKSEKIDIFTDEELKIPIPAYRCETFESLEKDQGLVILDLKNTKNSPWNKSLFDEGVDRLDVKNWKQVIKPLLKDIAIIVAYGLPSNSDSINLAIVKGKTENEEEHYQARYFGFDFSNKSFYHLVIPTGQKCNEFPKWKKVDQENKIKKIFERCVQALCCEEFAKGKFGLSEEHEQFKDLIVETYTQDILKEALSF